MSKQIDLNSSLDEVIIFYSDMVYKIGLANCGNSCDAEDVFQEVFLRYVKKQPEFHDEEHRKAWLIRVAINCSRKVKSSTWAKRNITLSEISEIPCKSTYENELYYELKKLPDKYREIIHLYYYQDMSTEEIANVLGKKPSTIRSQLARARKMLRKFMKDDDYV